MSYDLAVFDSNVASIERKEFLIWFNQQTQWEESHDYDDPKVSIPELRSWFLEMIEHFPAMNGPYPKSIDENEIEVSITDYSIGKTLIYAAFAWSKSQEAFETTVRLAEKHGVGFYNVSSTKGEVYFPNLKDNLLKHFELLKKLLKKVIVPS